MNGKNERIQGYKKEPVPPLKKGDPAKNNVFYSKFHLWKGLLFDCVVC